MARLRLAVALVVTGPAAVEIDGLRRALGDRALGRIAPHITLVPPVNVGADQLDDAVDVMRTAAAGVAPLRLCLGPAATFWPANPVVYLGVAGDVEDLSRLRTAVLAPPLARPITQPFVAHVTIAGDHPPDLIPATVDALRSYSAAVTMERVSLLCQRDGRIWEVIADAPLGGGRIVGRGGLEIQLVAEEMLDPEATRAAAGWVEHPATSRPLAIVARREGAVVGVATGTTDDELWIERLTVEPSARGQGIGSQLLAEMEFVGATRGCRRGRLLCAADGPAAAWCAGRGWSVGQRLDGWRHAEDFLLLLKDLRR